MNQEIHLPEVLELGRLVRELVVAVQQLTLKVQPAQAWYSRAELAHLKAIPVSAFYNKPWLLPGKPHKQAGVDRWSHGQVWDSGWIWKSDKDLNAKEGKRDGTQTETGVAAGDARTQAPVLRVLRERPGSRS